MITRGIGTSALVTRGYGGGIAGIMLSEVVRLASAIARVVGLGSAI